MSILRWQFYPHRQNKKNGEDASIPSVLHLLTTARRSCHFPTRQPTYVFSTLAKSSEHHCSRPTGVILFVATIPFLRLVRARDQKFDNRQILKIKHSIGRPTL